MLARHQIGAAILDAHGTIHLGLHLDAMVGRAAVCAEAVALGVARMSTAAPLILAAAVRHPKPDERTPPRLVPPCGLCRELLLDHAPDLAVVIGAPEGPRITALSHLLPHKYIGTKWAVPQPSSPAREGGCHGLPHAGT
ncbi:cytidine deaminase [Spongiactinospora gelatinilytica]|uniref:Cytidine deaminase n=1 Tax=Spongiactinospora gelatinilytica TaxID=2666298 RepID=A0A2W2HIJ1_9ACTN|nr:cytidine deaminase [Spongiactinospora gelatinilytica]